MTLSIILWPMAPLAIIGFRHQTKKCLQKMPHWITLWPWEIIRSCLNSNIQQFKTWKHQIIWAFQIIIRFLLKSSSHILRIKEGPKSKVFSILRMSVCKYQFKYCFLIGRHLNDSYAITFRAKDTFNYDNSIGDFAILYPRISSILCIINIWNITCI